MASEERKELRKARKAAAEEARLVEAGISEALHTRSGRALLWWVLDTCGYGNDTFTGNALSGAYKQGQQSIGLHLAQLAMRADNEAFLSLLKEKYDERSRNEPAGNGADDAEGDRADYDA